MQIQRQILINPSLLLCIRCKLHCQGAVKMFLFTLAQVSTIDLVRRVQLVGASLSEPHTSGSFVGSFYEYKQLKTIVKLTSSYVPQKFSVVSEIHHIWLLDRQCHGQHVTKFS